MPEAYLHKEAIAAIRSVVAYAHAHPLSMNDMLDIMNKTVKQPGKEHCLLLPGNLLCIYTEEEQVFGLSKHLILTQTTVKELIPSEETVELLLPYFSFTRPVEELVMGIRPLANYGDAIHIFEVPEGTNLEPT